MMDTSPRYAGFWPRLGSLLLDFIFTLPIGMLEIWAAGKSRLYLASSFIPGLLFGLFYSVYLVRRFGGTPGKLIMGIRITRVDGQPVGYKEAFLRDFPDFIFSLLTSIAAMLAVLHVSDIEYQSLSFLARYERIHQLAPSWNEPIEIAQNLWFWGELLVLLTNRKRRALHDFIAGTVVVHTFN